MVFSSFCRVAFAENASGGSKVVASFAGTTAILAS